MRGSDATPPVKLAFEFLVLTAARSGEVRGAQWAEIDTADHVWTVPATRTKAKREHRVPLCRRAEQILDAARTLGDGNPLVFPSARGKRLTDMALSGLLKDLEIGAVLHGFRSSFRDWAALEEYGGLNPALQRTRVLNAACAGSRRSRAAITSGRTWRSTRVPPDPCRP